MTDEIDVIVYPAPEEDVTPPERMDTEVKSGVPEEPDDPAGTPSPEEAPDGQG